MVDIVKTPNKGWGDWSKILFFAVVADLHLGIFARRKIGRGIYVGVYAGELLKDADGEERGKFVPRPLLTDQVSAG